MKMYILYQYDSRLAESVRRRVGTWDQLTKFLGESGELTSDEKAKVRAHIEAGTQPESMALAHFDVYSGESL